MKFKIDMREQRFKWNRFIGSKRGIKYTSISRNNRCVSSERYFPYKINRGNPTQIYETYKSDYLRSEHGLAGVKVYHLTGRAPFENARLSFNRRCFGYHFLFFFHGQWIDRRRTASDRWQEIAQRRHIGLRLTDVGRRLIWAILLCDLLLWALRDRILNYGICFLIAVFRNIKRIWVFRLVFHWIWNKIVKNFFAIIDCVLRKKEQSRFYLVNSVDI